MWLHQALLASSLLWSWTQSLSLTAGTKKCAGYAASNVRTSKSGLTADLKLIGKGCGIYGPDVKQLKLTVGYDTETRIHVKITDAGEKRYQVPKDVLPRPPSGRSSDRSSDLKFSYTRSPFTFTISRRSTGEKLFDTAGEPLIFEDQYLRVATSLGSKDPNIYGLGEHTSTFRLPTKKFTRTLWNRDAYGIPEGTNLYGSHPVYFEKRQKGTHAVVLVNSNGMDVKIDGGKLEYNVIGGVLDFYFAAGPSPVETARQVAEIIGTPALAPYWGLGNHQCRYGYRDWIDVAEVVANYSRAGIPLETMWTDIDYMKDRWIMTLDPKNYPLEKVQRIVSNLHKAKQHYVMMVDPAIAYQNYRTFNHGKDLDVFMKNSNGSIHKGVVWPGVAAFPDWFAPHTEKFWIDEFKTFFDPKKGIDIDGIWIDMNEPANFCSYPCTDPEGVAERQGLPPPRLPPRDPPRPIPGFPETGRPERFVRRRNLNSRSHSESAAFTPGEAKRSADAPGSHAPARRAGSSDSTFDPVSPPYAIANAAPGGLPDKTLDTSLVHANGLFEYDTHNLYGALMSTTTRAAALARRPLVRPLIITRSTFLGTGRAVGKWLGDNMSTWEHYRNSISGILQFAALYQIPLVGADVCGFGGNTTETLCARWTTLGAFYPFYRNHNGDTSISQEPYRWPLVTKAAINAMKIRYELIDHLYTQLWHQSRDGTPTLRPLWFEFPGTEREEEHFLLGSSILVAPVLNENVTSTQVRLPGVNERWYDYFSLDEIRAGTHRLTNVDYHEIPVFVRGGEVLFRRVLGKKLPNTTAEVRTKDCEMVVFPDVRGKAKGEVWVDDGESLEGKGVRIEFEYDGQSVRWKGLGSYSPGVKVKRVVVAGRKKEKRVGMSVERGGEVNV